MAKKYYRLDNILKLKASYNMVIGERSNGKTYASLEHGLIKYFEDGSQIGYIRRWGEDIKGITGGSIFNGLVANGVISKLSKGEWTGVYHYAGRYFLAKESKSGKRIVANEPFAYSFALNQMEHYKSGSYPLIRTIIFDEFLARDGVGLGDNEFVLLMNMLSTIIRDPSRTDVEVFLLANTVNFDSIYFKEFGINNIRLMKQGTIDFYTYGNSNTTLAVEYCETLSDAKSQINDRYFAFDNPRLKMITEGAWEMDVWPHCPCKYLPKDVLFSFFIKYNEDLLQADTVQHEDMLFLYIHRKTTPIKDESYDLIYTNEISPRPNKRLNITRGTDGITKKIKWFFANNRVFYQDNIVGEIVNNYLNWCASI